MDYGVKKMKNKDNITFDLEVLIACTLQAILSAPFGILIVLLIMFIGKFETFSVSQIIGVLIVSRVLENIWIFFTVPVTRQIDGDK